MNENSKFLILPDSLLNSGSFYYCCDFEQDDEEPFGFFTTETYIMRKKADKWRYCKKTDAYVDKDAKALIEKEISAVKNSIGNPYYITWYSILNDYETKVSYDILSSKISSQQNDKPRLLKPADCFVSNQTRNVRISNIPYLLPFVKDRVGPSCMYVVAHFRFNTKAAAAHFNEEMNVITNICKSLRIYSNIHLH